MLLTTGTPSASFWDRARGQNAQVLFDDDDDDYGVDHVFIKAIITLIDVTMADKVDQYLPAPNYPGTSEAKGTYI